MRITYEYECRVQILVMLLHKLLIVLLGLLAILFIKLGTEILLGQPPVLFLSVRWVNDGDRRNANQNLPIRLMSVLFPISIPPQYLSTILGAIEDQRAVTQ